MVNIKQISRILLVLSVFILLVGSVAGVCFPNTATVGGYIYSLNDTPVPIGTYVEVENVDSGQVRNGQTNMPNGQWVFSLDPHITSPGDFISVYAWNETHWGELNFTLESCTSLDNDFIMENTFPQTNTPPVLDSIGNREVDENSELTFTVTATDEDEDDLSFYTGAPGTLDPDTGVYSWTPSYVDSGIYTVTFNVTDGEAWDEETITLTVNDVNVPVELNQVGNIGVTENNLLSIQLTAYNPENDDLTYSTTANFGTFDAETGLFEWTPTIWESGDYEVTFGVFDGVYYDSETITISVSDLDVPVQLKPFDDLTGNERSTIYIYPQPSNPNWSEINLTIDSDLFFWDDNYYAFKWQTGYYSSGEYDFIITADDGSDIDQKTAHVTVQNNCNQFDKRLWRWNCDLQSYKILEHEQAILR